MLFSGQLSRRAGREAVERPGPWSIPAEELPAPEVAVLARTASGACVFRDHDAARCALHRAAGHAALPIACQQFPRVMLADDRGTHIALSHYCPTAAVRLFEDEALPRIVSNPPAWVTPGCDAGLDARGHWPPLLRPGVLMSHAAWSAWEAFAVAALGQSPLHGLARLHHAAERLRGWRPDDGPLEVVAQRVFSEAMAAPVAPAPLSPFEVATSWREAWQAVPAGRAIPPADLPSALAAGCWSAVLDTLGEFASPIGRYLAARAFASWMAYQGHGVRAHAASLRATLGILLVQMHACAPGGDGPARHAVLEAIRRTDLLLVHLADSAALAEAWNRVERFATFHAFVNPQDRTSVPLCRTTQRAR